MSPASCGVWAAVAARDRGGPRPVGELNEAPGWWSTHSQWDGKVGRVGTGGEQACAPWNCTQVGGDCTVSSVGHLLVP